MVFLTTDGEENIWAAVNASKPASYRLRREDVWQLLSVHAATVGEAAYAAGTPQNAEMVCQYLQHQGGSLVPLKLCSPTLLDGLITPAAQLSALWCAARQVDPTAGWYGVQAEDWPAYRLAEMMRRCSVFPLVPSVALSHPAWPAVSFINGGDQVAAAQILGLIVDPRWFRHPTRPRRLSRLCRYLGLDHNNYHIDRLDRVHRACGLHGSSMQAPGDFLKRIYADRTHGAAGQMATCRAWLRFVCDVWMATRAGREPADCFSKSEEAAAFLTHWRAWRAVEAFRLTSSGPGDNLPRANERLS